MADVGTLEVHLKYAKDLKDVEKLGGLSVGKQDPYCVLTCGTSSNRSKTHTDGGRNPVWEQAFLMPNISGDMVLKLEFYDENVVFRDVAIGTCKVTLRQVVSTQTEEVVAPVITKKGKHRGEVVLTLKYKPGKTVISNSTSKAIAAEKVVSRGPSAPKPGNWILPTYADTDCWKDYDPGHVLGKGTFGTTYSATEKKTGEKLAVKVISKRKLTTPEEIDDVRREVQIMHHLAGHENVVHLKGVYEDKGNVCLAMEVATGGELFDAIVKKGHYTERDAAGMIRTIVGVVAHCHNMGVIHRDLKPENFLLSDKTDKAVLKATDFGLSSFFQEGQIFTDIVGSAYYVAPEVLRRAYSKEADLWSCGVMLYILLCGYPPFHGDNEKKIFEAVMSKPVDFQSDPWPRVSDPAKDCVRKMLMRDPKKRASAIQILQHDWMRENGVASDSPLQLEVLTRIKKFSAMNRLKKEALKIIASNLPMDEISGMREIFMDIDTDKSGTITVEEFAEALRKKGKNLPEGELNQIMMEADVNGDGTIDYEEFLAATINMGKMNREDHLKRAFEEFDLDGNGCITREELTIALSKLGVSTENIDEIIQEVDTDGDNEIDFNEFCIMMRNMDA
ncbi:MAG: hypothetical protein WDW38_002778 [Sanguina aurantia]